MKLEIPYMSGWKCFYHQNLEITCPYLLGYHRGFGILFNTLLQPNANWLHALPFKKSSSLHSMWRSCNLYLRMPHALKLGQQIQLYSMSVDI